MDVAGYGIFGYDKDLDYAVSLYKGLGITKVCGGPDEKAAAAFLGAGLSYYICQGAFSLKGGMDAPENYCVDIIGNKTKWFSSGCPNNPRVRAKSLETAKCLARLENITGIAVDGARFASPASVESADAFFSCFCGHCLEEMEKRGYNKGGITEAVKALHACIRKNAPFDMRRHMRGITDWLDFRRDCINGYLEEYAEAIKRENSALETGIYPFSPSLSALVGQDYGFMGGVFDCVSPMIYRKYEKPGGVACLNHELSAISGYENADALALFSRLTGLDIHGMGNAREILGLGLPCETVGSETGLAKAAMKKAALRPIIYLKDKRLHECIDMCLLNGADSVDFYAYARNDMKYLTKGEI